MNADHVVGGGIVAVITTNLPAVITAAHWIGADAPALQETALIVGIGAAVYGIARRVFVRTPRRAELVDPAAQPKPAALPIPPPVPPPAPKPPEQPQPAAAH